MPYAKRKSDTFRFILGHLTGGFALAARWAGLETVQFVEIDKFCQKVLNKNFPGVPIHDDIKTFKYDGEPPFILTGGFPCQPFSCAGKRRGKEDDRYLWPEMLRVVSEAKPRWVIGENVAGFINLGLDQCVSDLENQGYEVQAFVIPACAVGAPHRRDRVWIVAMHSAGTGCLRGTESFTAQEGLQQKPESTGELEGRLKRSHCTHPHAPHRRDRVWIVANNQSVGCGSRWAESTGLIGSAGTTGADCHAADTARELSHGSREPRGRRGEFADKSCSLADTSNQGLPGREWPGPHEQGQATHGSTSERNHTWDEPWIEVATRLCRVDDGLPRQVDRVNRLKALGNAIVPQVAYEIMKAIIEVD